jgi:hypothetical protein
MTTTVRRVLAVALALVAHATDPPTASVGLAFGVACGAECDGGAPAPFAIEVVDKATERGVPLVELTTVNNVRFVTDSNGLVAVLDPDLMGQSIYFSVRSHGYEYPKDGFGFRGKALEVKPGGKARLELARVNIAERLYRVTGGGIYRDSVLLGRPAPIREPLLAAKVFGCDSVMTAVYRGKVHWFWGDTNRPSYPLGHFHMTGATTPLPGAGGPDPERGIDFDYFVGEDGFARPTCQMPGEGPTWIGGLAVLRDTSGRERMYAGYVKVRPPMEIYEHGLVVWDDERDRFVKVTTFAEGLPIYPDPQDHTFHHADGDEYVYFTSSLPLTRVKADAGAFADPRRYEGFTCLEAGTRLADRRLDRDEGGRLRYAWKANTPPLSQKDQAALVKDGLMKPEEALVALRDVESGRAVIAHNGSVDWNAYRRRWVLIGSEEGGRSSALGEIWFAEADAPTGPWVYARKVVTHDKYSFYNPKHHSFFDRDGGRVIFFEGTYTHTFSGNPEQTPRYDYNQVMYKLDLSDPRLNLPVAFDAEPDDGEGGRRVGFFALERPGDGTVPIYERRDERGGRELVAGGPSPPGAPPVFYALPADHPSPPPNTALLFEFTREDGTRLIRSTAGAIAGYRRSASPACRVWVNPIAAALPRERRSP